MSADGKKIVYAEDVLTAVCMCCDSHIECCDTCPIKDAIMDSPEADAVPVDFINQKIVELKSCADQHFNDGHEVLAACIWETIRLLGGIVKEWRGKENADADN